MMGHCIGMEFSHEMGGPIDAAFLGVCVFTGDYTGKMIVDLLY